METQIIEKLVVQFPSVAAWIIVALLGLIGFGVAYFGRKFMARMDTQDTALLQIKDLLASEIGHLRELHHAIDKRVAVIETHINVDGRWRRDPPDRERDS